MATLFSSTRASLTLAPPCRKFNGILNKEISRLSIHLQLVSLSFFRTHKSRNCVRWFECCLVRGGGGRVIKSPGEHTHNVRIYTAALSDLQRMTCVLSSTSSGGWVWGVRKEITTMDGWAEVAKEKEFYFFWSFLVARSLFECVRNVGGDRERNAQ